MYLQQYSVEGGHFMQKTTYCSSNAIRKSFASCRYTVEPNKRPSDREEDTCNRSLYFTFIFPHG